MWFIKMILKNDFNVYCLRYPLWLNSNVSLMLLKEFQLVKTSNQTNVFSKKANKCFLKKISIIFEFSAMNKIRIFPLENKWNEKSLY